MKNKNKFLVTLKVFVIVINFLSTSVRAHNDGSTNSKVCTTEACKKAASKILEKMDVNVSPCDDFYKFTCGKFLKEAVIPDDEPRFFATFVDVNEGIIKKAKSNFIGLKTDDSKTSLFVYNYYQSCMNTSVIENQGLDPLKKILKNLGGWPVLMSDKWSETNFEWDELVNKVQKLGYAGNYLLTVKVDIDIENSNKHILYLKEPRSSSAPQNNLINGSMDDIYIAGYYNYMLQMAKILGADENEASEQLKESLKFEIELARIRKTADELREPKMYYYPMSINELERIYPSIYWLKYINNKLAPITSVNQNETVIVEDPSYISKLEPLLSKTSKRTLANYILWKIIEESVDYLNDDARKAQLAYLAATTGKKERSTRDKECWTVTSSAFKIKVGSLFVKKFFNADSKKLALEMVSNIQQAFINNLKNISWIDEKTKKMMITKAEVMKKFIGYPNEILDDEKVDEIHKNLKIDADDYLGNALKVKLAKAQNSIAQLKQPVNESEWKEYSDVTRVNALYSQNSNSMVFPAAILQGSLFSEEVPMYMNYGGIGMIMGHELVHGFDDQGRNYDQDGNLMKEKNLNSETEKNYLEKTNCFINQYGNFTVPEANMNLNGKGSVGENVADNGGFKMSYLAYNNWTKLQGNIVEPQLPGLDYTPQQMFWINIGYNFCTKYSKEALIRDVVGGDDVHCPSEYRVLGTVMNSNEFSRDFNCPSGSKMNPKNKCVLW